MKLVVLSTDTPHHRFFAQKIHSFIKIRSLLLETSQNKPAFDVSAPFKKKETEFELKNFFSDVPNRFPNCPVLSYESMNDQAAINKLRQLSPDIGIVFGTSKLKRRVISCFSYALLNVHRGIPEYYRGLDSDLWAIKDKNYDQIGTTLHLVEPELDTGDILGKEILTLNQDMRIHKIRYYTTLLALKISIKVLKQYLDGKMVPAPQFQKGEYYSHMPSNLKKELEVEFNSYCKNL